MSGPATIRRGPGPRLFAGAWRIASLLLLLAAASGAAAGVGTPTPDLASLSLAELLEVEVTTAARRSQPMADVSAAAFVLTGDDIRRAGVTSLPDALRLVPGVHVARIDASKWAISVRGFSAQFANKLLVLVDGRTVYTPTFSGVHWDVLDLSLEDVERIEVIRGPGAALWGSNAVNGIINIITSHSAASHGLAVSVSLGTEEKALISVQQGGVLSGGTAYRVYGKVADRSSSVGAAGDDARDAWRVSRAGFRLDAVPSPEDDLMLTGQVYQGRAGQRYPWLPSSASPPHRRAWTTRTSLSGGHLQARWTHRFPAGSEAAAQAYVDRTERSEAVYGAETRDTYDVDLQHRLAWGGRHETTWGAAARHTADTNENTFYAALEPADRVLRQASFFLQDETSLLDDRLRLTCGTKVEWNTGADASLQPNARLLVRPAPGQAAWAAVSRALRTPSRFDYDGRVVVDVYPADSLLPGAPATLVTIEGDRDVASEELVAVEAGYRLQLASLLVDAAVFRNAYDDLNTLELAGVVPAAPPDSHQVLPLVLGNGARGRTWGLELSADWQPRPWCRLRTQYSSLYLDLELKPPSRDPDLTLPQLRANPRHQLSHHASLDLPGDVELDVVARCVGRLPGLGMPAYTGLDLRVGWSPVEGTTLALVGRDLLDARHVEYAAELEDLQRTQVERSVHVEARWRL